MTPSPDDVGGHAFTAPPAPRLVPPTYSGTFIHPTFQRLERAWRDHGDVGSLAHALGYPALADLVHGTEIVIEKVVTVPDQKIDELESVPPLPDPPLPSLKSYLRVNLKNVRDVDAFLREYVSMILSVADDAVADGDEIKAQFYYELAVSQPTASVPDDPLTSRQAYLDAAPRGIGARWAWEQGLNGKGAALIDLEQGWIFQHEDLADRNIEILVNDNRDGEMVEDAPKWLYRGHHGTAVLGVVLGAPNQKGAVGIAAGIRDAIAISHFKRGPGTDPTKRDPGTDLHVADAIARALAEQTLKSGDVLLLEVQRGGGLPTEVDQVDFLAIHLAARHGVIVIEAAGNGGKDLDDDEEWSEKDYFGHPLFPFTLKPETWRGRYVDSGATLVGAACPQLPHDRWRRSNYGARVNCYGWGGRVVTAGYGDLNTRGTPRERMYTAGFGGTSAAAAIVAGAALVVQGAYLDAGKPALTSMDMRDVLSDKATGTPQGGSQSGSIGVMPNLEATFKRLWDKGDLPTPQQPIRPTSRPRKREQRGGSS